VTVAEFHGPRSVADDLGGAAGMPGGGRVPPHDESAEQSVLGSMMLSKDAIADVVETTARRTS
jgi:replicative DNA helicase